MSVISQSRVEEAALAWLESLDFTVKHGPKIVPSAPGNEHSMDTVV